MLVDSIISTNTMAVFAVFLFFTANIVIISILYWFIGKLQDVLYPNASRQLKEEVAIPAQRLSREQRLMPTQRLTPDRRGLNANSSDEEN